MDFQSAMETFAEAWVAANTQTPLTEAAAAEAQALAFSRSAESMSTTSHELMADKDSEHEYDVVRSTSLRSPHTEAHLAKVRTPSVTGKSIPVHCIVEQVPSPQNCDQSGEPLQPTVELDSYAIVPSSTLFNELVRTGLVKLGYTQSETIGAKGAIHIKNWKPLSFDMITDDPEATVGEILGELTTVATLRIRLYSRVRVSTAHDVKEKLLQLLLTQSQSLLVSAGCPIDENLLSLISKGIIPYEISEDTRKKFDHWYLQQVMQHRQQHQQQPQPPSHQSPTVSLHQPSAGAQGLTPASTPCPRVPGASSSASVAGAPSSADSVASPNTPTSQQHSPYAHSVQKTRMRTSFDPELELPKLHRWFAENQHPTRIQIQQYVRELNLLESRKGRKPLDVNNVVYWFKNARAAHKRAEMRQLNGNGGMVGGGRSPNHDTASSDAGGPPPDHYLANGDAHAHDIHDTQDSNNSGASLGRSNVYGGSAASPGSNNGTATAGGGGGGSNNDNVPLNLSGDPRDRMTDHMRSSPDAAHARNDHVRSSPEAGSAHNLNAQGRESNQDGLGENKGGSRSSSSNGYAKADPDGGSNKAESEGEGRSSEDASPPSPGGCQSYSRDLLSRSDVVVKREPVDDDDRSPELSDDDDDELVANAASPPHLTGSAPTMVTGATGPGGASPVLGGGYNENKGSCSPLERMGLPLHPPSAELARSMIYMASYLPSAIASLEERRKRNRTFIDPVTEVPRLEQWFALNTHPSHNLILKYTEELNKMPYRQKFPKLEPKNVQFWFKNRRAKCKRLKLSL